MKPVHPSTWRALPAAFLAVGILSLAAGSLAGPPRLPGDGDGGCNDADLDGRCDSVDTCPALYNPIPRPCPDPSADLQLVPGAGRPGRWDSFVALNVLNTSSYQYRISLDSTRSSSHAYCTTCREEYAPATFVGCRRVIQSCCSRTTTPNPKSYGGSQGTDGAIAPCGDSVLDVGDNVLKYQPFHHCCDITKDVLFAVKLEFTQFRHISDAADAWRNFPDPGPVKRGWASNGHAVQAGYNCSKEGVVVETITTPGCEFNGSNQHYAASDADFDQDGLPDACDCDDDADGCLDGTDVMFDQSLGTLVDTSRDPSRPPAGNDCAYPQGCIACMRPWGRYANYPANCRSLLDPPLR